MSQSESFLRRWPRLKLEAAVAPAASVVPAAPVLPEVGALDFDADFSAFMHPGVDGETRRNALRKLFITDHYRAMDGLDVYVEDYSSPELLSTELLKTLDHAQALLQQPEAPVVVPPAQDPEQA